MDKSKIDYIEISSESDSDNHVDKKNSNNKKIAIKRELMTTNCEPFNISDSDDDIEIVSFGFIDPSTRELSSERPVNSYQDVSTFTANNYLSSRKSEIFYGLRGSLLEQWSRCYIILAKKSYEEDADNNVGFKYSSMHYTVYFIDENQSKNLPEYYLAEEKAPVVQLKIGTRIIAKHCPLQPARTRKMHGKHFYAGIVGESICSTNDYRYLVFFDTGHVHYVHPSCVRIVFGNDQWQHVHSNAKKFMEYRFGANKNDSGDHLPIVVDTIGARMKVELNGKWLFSHIDAIDGKSMIQILYEDTKRLEWFYRGSPRLGPIWRQLHKKLNIKSIVGSQDMSLIETHSTSEDDSDDEVENNSVQVHNKSIHLTLPMHSKPTFTKIKPNELIKCYRPPKKYVKHQCDRRCRYKIKENLNCVGLLIRPILLGWNRTVAKKRKSITYIAPCGKSIRSIDGVYQYLIETNSPLAIDNFTFDQMVDCFRECITVTDTKYILSEDISKGIEKMPIRVMNNYTKNGPDEFTYVERLQINANVPKYLNRKQMSCCDCTDNCYNKLECSCWQLTLNGLRYTNQTIDKCGYEYKRLYMPLETGIFECNVNCKCSENCFNRVVQKPLQHRIELFKTKNRGWGVRCLNDIPEGAFICCYFGDLLTEEQSERWAKKHGDEYFAQLTFIETAEQFKDGYEADVEFDKSLRMNWNDNINAKDESTQPYKRLRVDHENDEHGVDNNELLGPIINYFPTCDQSRHSNGNATRRLYGLNESEFIIDGKRRGNIGRFFNHSCDPNMFLQVVFVDTHDLRFPWIALFALDSIKAGTEMTWNYNYAIDSIPGRVLYCKCGSKHCVGRLL